MASSRKLHELLQIKPKAPQFRVYGKVDQGRIEYLLDVLTTKNGLEATEIKLTTDNMVKDIATYQTSIALGIYFPHTKPLLNTLQAEITDHLLTGKEMSTIVNSIPSSDPLFKHLVNCLCHRRYKKEIPNIVAFEKWLGKNAQKMLQGVRGSTY
jgi:hypothetical protein